MYGLARAHKLAEAFLFVGQPTLNSHEVLTMIRGSSGHVSLLTMILLMSFGQTRILCSSKLTENAASVQSPNLV